ncbi:gfo/Idh/MocA family oxidoreductase [Clostridiales bacterium COT073_COT-073]|nr:gfo/Idh/MocA family oxidoreductase [Clostridiales bacterium COT073_COT-073]
MKAAVIGIGFIGAVHIEQLRRLGDVEVVALADRTEPEEKAKQLFVPKGYHDYKEMIDKEKPDCVHICTPNNTHYQIAKYAIEKGIHVLCEKPMTYTLQEANELRTLAREKGVIHAMNFNYRFYPMAYQMREMVKNGEVGNIYTIHGGYLQDWLYFDTDYNWRLEKEASGASRAFADIGSHWIDLVEFVTGLKVVEVLADFATFHKTRKKPKKSIDTYSGMSLRPDDYEEVPIDTEDYAAVLFHMNNGAHACCHISQVFAGRKNQMTLAIGGSKCAVEWDSENSNSLWIGKRGEANQIYAKDPSILAPKTAILSSYPGGHVEGFADSFKQNFRQIYDRIASGKTGEYGDFETGYREMYLGEKIIQSAREKRWISVDE